MIYIEQISLKYGLFKVRGFISHIDKTADSTTGRYGRITRLLKSPAHTSKLVACNYSAINTSDVSATGGHAEY